MQGSKTFHSRLKGYKAFSLSQNCQQVFARGVT